MPTVVSFVNFKGGVGKTALAVNFSAYSARHGYKTLLIDLDPQTNATFCCLGVDGYLAISKEGTVADLLGVKRATSAEGVDKSAGEVVLKDVWPNLDLIPSNLELFTVDLDLASATAREKILKKSLKPIMDEYDIIVCDCPPNLTLPTQNALGISNFYVIPVNPDFLSSTGVAILKKRISKFAEDIESEIELAGIVLTRIGRTSQFRAESTEALRQTFSDDILDNHIAERSSIAESASKASSIFEMVDAKATAEFTAVCNELWARLKLPLTS